MNESLIFDVQDFAVKDGAGIRTLVFLKGCPLRCVWCSNPESQKYCAEIVFNGRFCQKCHRCVSLCPDKAISYNADGGVIFNDRNICEKCVARFCADACPENAIRTVGRRWTFEELYKKIQSNSLFYRNSGGGVTLSGGEPLSHPEFVHEFLKYLIKSAISVGVETCGYFDWDKLESIIGIFDFIYYDIKCLDPLRHAKITGVSNEKILSNFSYVSRIMPSKIIVSVPVIPGINVEAGDIVEIASFIKNCGVNKMRLLPYHSFGASKYEGLGREYKISDMLNADCLNLNEIVENIKKNDIDCWIE